MRTMQEVWSELDHLSTAPEEKELQSPYPWRGKLSEFLILLRHPDFYREMSVGVPFWAPDWARRLVQIRRLIDLCLERGYDVHQRGEHIEVRPRGHDALLLQDERVELFEEICRCTREMYETIVPFHGATRN